MKQRLNNRLLSKKGARKKSEEATRCHFFAFDFQLELSWLRTATSSGLAGLAIGYRFIRSQDPFRHQVEKKRCRSI